MTDEKKNPGLTGYEKTDEKKSSFIKKKDRVQKKRETGYEKNWWKKIFIH